MFLFYFIYYFIYLFICRWRAALQTWSRCVSRRTPTDYVEPALATCRYSLQAEGSAKPAKDKKPENKAADGTKKVEVVTEEARQKLKKRLISELEAKVKADEEAEITRIQNDLKAKADVKAEAKAKEEAKAKAEKAQKEAEVAAMARREAEAKVEKEAISLPSPPTTLPSTAYPLPTLTTSLLSMLTPFPSALAPIPSTFTHIYKRFVGALKIGRSSYIY
eukprot:1194437-Prorocentrum_minimum.AAC.3